ncbi:MAG: EAL domain-containing protein [Sterolibacterium sp.]
MNYLYSGNVRRNAVIFLLAWSLIIALSLIWNLTEVHRQSLEVARHEAAAHINKNIAIRNWVASHGGVYVPPTEQTPPNPYLSVADRDITSTGGKELTLMNPAYVLREMQRQFSTSYGEKEKIVSLKPLNPINTPNDEEHAALLRLERGEKEILEIRETHGSSYLELMQPFIVEEPCLKCHGHQGYRVGDVRGGIQVSIPLEPFLVTERAAHQSLALGHGFIWMLGLMGIGLFGRRSSLHQREVQVAMQTLSDSEARFRSLANMGAEWYWEHDKEFRFTEVSDGKRFLQTIPENLDPIGKTCWELGYADMDEAAWQQHRELLERHEPFRDFEVRRRGRDGRICSVSLSGDPIFDKTGIFSGYRGIGIDITARKKASEALHLAALVYESSSEAMAVTDANNLIISVNPAFERTTGYGAAEVIGKDLRILRSERHENAFYQAMWHALKTAGCWQGEIWNRRKDGEIFLVRLTINTIYSENGSVQRYVALFSDITEMKEAEELIWKQANFDALTDLPNRRMFYDRLAQEIKKAHRAGKKLALLFIDLDHFKEINDTLGHHMGDNLLVEAARRICECVRETDTLARLGGDEFTILLTELDDPNSVERAAIAILEKLAEPFQLGHDVVVVSASIGITMYPNDATDIGELLKNADQAMYVAKKLGRNRYSHFTPALQEAAQKRLKLTGELRNAVAGEQLRAYFQPIVHLASGHIHKAEALIRWQHPQLGMVSPAAFIPLAEETGLIFEIGDWVFKESARWAKRWRSIYHKNFQVSVNKSPAQFYRSSESDCWLAHLQDIGLPGESLVVEITEGLLLKSDSPIMDGLLAYRDSGIQVAIDDFGTGYSSLSYLKKFNIDYLKIDQSFTRNLAPGSSDMALSEAIIVMAHKLGLEVIAEGVETPEQRDLLVAAGCDYAQGYLFSRPLPPEEFESLFGIGRPA